MIRHTYDTVMDSERNPLRTLPKMVRFQYMLILSYMWSVVLTIWVGSGLVFGFSIAVHTILLVGVFFTADIFRRARAYARSQSDERDVVEVRTHLRPALDTSLARSR